MRFGRAWLGTSWRPELADVRRTGGARAHFSFRCSPPIPLLRLRPRARCWLYTPRPLRAHRHCAAGSHKRQSTPAAVAWGPHAPPLLADSPRDAVRPGASAPHSALLTPGCGPRSRRRSGPRRTRWRPVYGGGSSARRQLSRHAAPLPPFHLVRIAIGRGGHQRARQLARQPAGAPAEGRQATKLFPALHSSSLSNLMLKVALGSIAPPV